MHRYKYALSCHFTFVISSKIIDWSDTDNIFYLVHVILIGNKLSRTICYSKNKMFTIQSNQLDAGNDRFVDIFLEA